MIAIEIQYIDGGRRSRTKAGAMRLGTAIWRPALHMCWLIGSSMIGGSASWRSSAGEPQEPSAKL